MRRRPSGNSRPPTAAAGFSLVELLTVIAIIVLLIGILVPAVSKVRETAKVAATKALIGTLSAGIETFRADQQVGGVYPPSASDWMNKNGRLTYTVGSPYNGQGGTSPVDPFEISGAGLLVWALAGADLSGTPGFRPFRDGVANPRQEWARDTDNLDDQGGAYELGGKADGFQPVWPRVGPLVDLANVEVTRWNENADTKKGLGSFEIPVETEAHEAIGVAQTERPKRNYPVFLDPFGGPILYWRADPMGIQAVDRTLNDIDLSNKLMRKARGIYHFLDNGPLISYVRSPREDDQDPVVLRPRSTSEPHNLRWPDLNISLPGPEPRDRLDGFWQYVRNHDIQSRFAPHRVDSYLLISAGPDGIYGTGDDVANFEHNGAELSDPN